MHIVKDLNDFNLNSRQRVFVDFIRDKIGSSCSYEKIKNTAYKRQYAEPLNDIVAYNLQSAYPRVRRYNAN